MAEGRGRRTSSLPSRVSTPQLRLHVAKPISTRRPSAEKQEHPPRRLRSHDKIQIRRLQQGSDNNATAVARPQWIGFSPIDVDTRRGYTTPPTGKGAPMASPSPRLSPTTPLAPMSSQEAGSLTVQHLQTPLSRRPMEASSEGNDAPAARDSRTAASTITPSDPAAHGAGPASTAHVTPPHVEAVADHRRRHKHPPPSLPSSQQPWARATPPWAPPPT